MISKTNPTHERAVFFDLDGTLADTRHDIAAAVNHVRRDLGLAALPLEAVVACVGRGARYLLEQAIPEQSDFDAAYAQFKIRYPEHATDTVRLYPGVRETLAHLVDAGWKLGVCTNKPRVPTRIILRHFGLDAIFGKAVVAGGDCAELKPSPTPLVECARRLDRHALTSADWMIGDNWTDLDAAAAAGIKSCFCSFGFGRLGESTFTVRADRFAAIPALIGSD